MGEERLAVVLLSGGLDSTTVMAIAKSEGYELHALTVDYGQRHICEIDAAGKVCDYFDAAEHRIVSVDLSSLGGSALTSDIPVPQNRSDSQISTGIPVTYVPLRNVTMLSIAAGWAEIIGAAAIYAGMNSVDYSGYPDCRPEFIRAFGEMLLVSSRRGVEGNPPEIITPLVHLKKSEIIHKGMDLNVDYSITWSCYAPINRENKWYACGKCDSCTLRLRGFREAGYVDPILYLEPT